MNGDNENSEASKEKGLAQGQQAGDYLIGALISKGTNTLTYSAQQVSVQREVTICSLAEPLKKDSTYRDEFIEDVRVKASIDHPLIGSVLEAVNDENHCFFAMEKLHGSSFMDIHEEGESLSPLSTVRIIRNIAGACKYLEARQVATLALTLHDIYLDKKHHCRISNMAIAGETNPSTATHDKQLIGQFFQDLLEPNQPGSTRTASLLEYMADRKREEPLSWDQIYDLSDEVERQLAETANAKKHTQIQSSTMRMKPAIPYAAIAKFFSLLIVLAVIGGVAYYFYTRKPAPQEREMVDMIQIPAGSYTGPNGLPLKMREFWIDAHEVTIGEYAKFLQALNLLTEDQIKAYQHEDHPETKTSHEPDDWYELYTAAKNGTPWKKLKVDLNYPIIGVDWWDAYTYAEWKGRRLPTREEWYTACTAGGDPSQLEASGWSPVDQTNQTSHGIHGLAGNVSEWMRKKSLDPADPSKPARYILSGASYLRPKFGARAREWVNDRNLRRADLGFRTLSTSEPSQ